MSRAEAAAWWTEVEELRERIERRRTQQAAAAGAEPRRPRSVAAVESVRSTQPPPFEPDLEPTLRPRAVRATTEPPEAAARRTVRIRGQAIPTVVAPRLRPVEGPGEPVTAPPETRRPSRARPYGTTRPPRPRPRPAERIGANPDRLAAWAFALALLTLLVAAVSAHGL
jgi:hypothetical protein